MIGNEVLRFPEKLRKLADPAVAPSQLAQHPPAMGFGHQLKELQRGDLDGCSGHMEIISI
jgi:hypothetical protein